MNNEFSFSENFFSVIILIGIVQGIFLGFLFLAKRNRSRLSNKYLGIILLLITVHNFDFWASYTLLTLRIPLLLDISVPFSFMMGPLFYHYFFFSLKNKRDNLLFFHYVPFILFFFYSLFFIFQPDEFKYNVFVQSRHINLPLKEVVIQHSFDPLGIRNWFGYFISIQLCIYLILSLFMFFKHIKENSESVLKTKQPIIARLRNFILSFILIIIVSVVIQLFFPGGRFEYLLATCFTVFIYFISFNLITGSAFFNQTLFPDKYLKSSLSENMKTEYRNQIEQLMIKDKPYTDNLFSLKKLSVKTGIPVNHLSQVINEAFRLSFFEYTRQYRIEEAQKQLLDPVNLNVNIEEIAYKVGYNSKSAFNKAFLEITGQTPLVFKKQNKV